VELVHQFPARHPFLDLGGGNGFVSSCLGDNGIETILMEPGLPGAAAGRQRGVDTVIHATLQQAKPRPECLPAVGMFDVLEHIEDDAGLIRQLHDYMEPRGLLYLTVPAFQFLWSAEDAIAGHYRRYNCSTLRNVLVENGFEVLYCSYIFQPLLFAVLLFRSLPYRLGLGRKVTAVGRDHADRPGGLLGALKKSLGGEVESIRNQKPCGFGSSCIADKGLLESLEILKVN